MAQVYFFPPNFSSNSSVSGNGGPIPTSSTLVAGDQGGIQTPLTLTSGNLNVNIAGSSTPFNINLADVGGVAISLGQKLMASSLPVTLASDQSALPVSQSGSWNILNITGTVSLPTGAATSANQTNASQKTQIVDGSGNVIASTSNALNVQVENFPATQPVSGTVTANQGTSPWVDNISQFGGSAVSLGQKVSAASMPVVIASDQSAVPVSQSGTWNINNVSGTVSLPTGAATSANQTNGSQKSQIATPTPLTITQAAITVGTSAVRLTVSGSAPAATRVTLVATPDSTSSALFYIGSSSVTNSGATRGIQIEAGQSFIANSDAGDYWIVSDTAAQTVEVLEQA